MSFGTQMELGSTHPPMSSHPDLGTRAVDSLVTSKIPALPPWTSVPVPSHLIFQRNVIASWPHCSPELHEDGNALGPGTVP